MYTGPVRDEASRTNSERLPRRYGLRQCGLGGTSIGTSACDRLGARRGPDTMDEDRDSRRIRGYCALCISRCGAIATIEAGRFVRLEPDPTHPTGHALCAKGRAG